MREGLGLIGGCWISDTIVFVHDGRADPNEANGKFDFGIVAPKVLGT